MNNPLLEQPFNTPFHTPPFSQFKLEHYKPAIEAAIKDAQSEIEGIVSQEEIPTFSNTMEKLENSGTKLDRISSIFFNLNSAETTPEMQQLAQEISPLLSQHANDILFNQPLFERIKTVHQNQNEENLNLEQKRLLDKTFKSFSRNGALLSPEKQETLRKINTDLAMLSLQFGQNVLAETNAYFLQTSDKNDLEGLPYDVLSAAQEEAKNRELDGWVFTLQIPSYLGFMKFGKNREIREKLYRAYGSKAFKDNEFNNTKNIQKIVALRHQKAQLLGYNTYADLILEERMAKSSEKVNYFLSDLLEKAFPFAKKEVEELVQYAKEKDGIEQLMPWDHTYYSERIKEEKYQLSDSEIKPYFALENVLLGAFKTAEKLYGISFEKRSDIEVYHPDVVVYEVKEKSSPLGLLYTDFFPREGKRSGAWMTSYREQFNENDERNIPLVSIVCNFSKPTQEAPSLLTFNEVTTLFHEFGHALHGLLSNTNYQSLSGTNVYWDFVELPSQFMENFCYEEETLALFAKHYKTKEIIPTEIIERIKKAANFMEGYQTVRQVSFGKLDMAWHTKQPKENTNVSLFESDAFEGTQLYPMIKETNMSCAFSHIFQGGYAAGYYSYKWAEVLDADAFDYLKQNGIFKAEIAQKFRALLASGGTQDPMELYKTFRGQEPTNKALLKRAGLVVSKESANFNV